MEYNSFFFVSGYAFRGKIQKTLLEGLSDLVLLALPAQIIFTTTGYKFQNTKKLTFGNVWNSEKWFVYKATCTHSAIRLKARQGYTSTQVESPVPAPPLPERYAEHASRVTITVCVQMPDKNDNYYNCYTNLVTFGFG